MTHALAARADFAAFPSHAPIQWLVRALFWAEAIGTCKPKRSNYLDDRYFQSTVKKALCRMFVNTRVLRPRKKMPDTPSCGSVPVNQEKNSHSQERQITRSSVRVDNLLSGRDVAAVLTAGLLLCLDDPDGIGYLKNPDEYHIPYTMILYVRIPSTRVSILETFAPSLFGIGLKTATS